MNPLIEKDIRRITGDELAEFGDAMVYEVVDPDYVEGVYYIVVNLEDQSVTVTSLNVEGEANFTDLMLLQGKVDRDPQDEGMSQDSITWTGDIDDVLEQLLGSHASIIQQDLAKGSTDLLDDPEASPSDRDDPSNLAFDDMSHVVGDTSFDVSAGFDFDAGVDPLANDEPEVPPSIDPDKGTVSPDDVNPDDLPPDDTGDEDDDEEAPPGGIKRVQVRR